MPHRELLDAAVAAAEEAGRVLLGHWRPGGSTELEIERKARNDLVSRADREAEGAALAVLRERFPDHRVVAEEGGAASGGAASEWEWLVDPLDGTTNFLQGLPIWSVSVACRHRRRLVAAAVLDPLAGNLFAAGAGMGATWNGSPMRVSTNRETADAFLATGFPFRAHAALDPFLRIFRDVFLEVRAIRRCGSAALDLAHVAAGIYDGFFELRLSPWDVAAGALLIEEAGGRVTDFDGGRDYLRSGNIVAATEALHPRLLERVRGHLDQAAVDRLVPIEPPPIEPLPDA
ncbi:MAG TPA: inositol monophosphatase family protein [Thermoanaerobaculia bacterium]|nr:inositol monophosphatase family protein [Thermoanaerobaculia bacterium]